MTVNFELFSEGGGSIESDWFHHHKKIKDNPEFEDLEDGKFMLSFQIHSYDRKE